MKSIANSVRVAIIRRRSISPEPFESELSSNVQQQTNQKLFKNQHLGRRISRSAPLKDQTQKHIPTFGTPKTARLHDINEVNVNNRHHPQISNSPLPSSPPLSKIQTPTIREQTATNNLHQIPSKAKWSTKKKVLVGVSAALLLAALIIIPTVLGVLLTRSAELSSTTTIASTTSSTIVSAYWSFDNMTTDLYNVYNGQLINNAAYSPISSYQPYVGHGRTLTIVASLNQSFLVSTPFFDLSYTSFTIEAWIYLTITTGDRGIFGQCQCSTCANQCLYLIIRGSRLYIGFTLNDLSGSSTIPSSTWQHIAFVYNYQTQQQILYLNGVQDTIKSNAQPYQGKNGSILIGSTQVFSTTNFFNGYIDNLMITTRAKSAVEILRDASLMAYYSFDLPYTDLDSSPNGLNGTSVNTVTVNGRVNQALRFIGTTSYFQAYGFYQIPYGVSSNKPFSVSMWVNPSSISNCALVQLAATASSTTFSCTNYLGIYTYSGSQGQIVVHSYASGSPPTLTGPFLPINTWTHISSTYTQTNGITLYVNGNLFGATGTLSFFNTGSFAYLTLGYAFYCYYSTINGGFQGSMDEVYIHNRELTQADVTALANP